MLIVFVRNIFDDGARCSDVILVEQFKTLSDAKKEGKTYLLSEDSYFFVKEYQDGSPIIGGKWDTGRVVYSSRGQCEDCPNMKRCTGSQNRCDFYTEYIRQKRKLSQEAAAVTQEDIKFHFACAYRRMYTPEDIQASFDTYEEAYQYQMKGFWDDSTYGIIVRIKEAWYRIFDRIR